MNSSRDIIRTAAQYTKRRRGSTLQIHVSGLMNVEPTSDLPSKMDWVQVAKMVGRATVASVRGIISLIYMILYPGIQLIRFLLALLQWALDPFMRLGLRLFYLAVFPLRVLAKFEVSTPHSRLRKRRE